jgi:membrane protein insertase Oxa1/YidC/SpoIIIJ
MIVFFTFSMPAAMGLYWVVGNILGIAQSSAIYWLLSGFPKKKTKPQIVPVNQTSGS